jgi:hypothetical protein
LVLAIAILPHAAQGQVLTFEGILAPGASNGAIGNFYDGGAGPNFGIDFSSNALAVCLNTPGHFCNNTSRGGLGDPNSQLGGLFFLDGPSTFMNSNTGFTSGFSFFYSAINSGGSFQVFSGLDGTGTLLGSLTLGTTPSTCDFALYGAGFCPYIAAGLDFSGTAHSVVFAGVANQIAFDDVTFGSSTPGEPGTTTPEPASIVLMATGLCGAGIVARRRRPRKAA